MYTQPTMVQVHIYLPKQYNDNAPLAVKSLYNLGINQYSQIDKICRVVANSMDIEGCEYDGWEFDASRNEGTLAVYWFWNTDEHGADGLQIELIKASELTFKHRYERYTDKGGRLGVRPVGTTGL